MLASNNRLKKEKDFEQVFKKGKGIKQDSLYLKYKKNNLEQSRFGIVVGKDYSKKAVERNKIKRRIREIVKDKDIKGLDIVIVVLPGADNNYNELKKNIDKLFRKIK